MLVTSIFSFSHNVFWVVKSRDCVVIKLIEFFVVLLSTLLLLALSSIYTHFIPFPNKPWFLRLYSTNPVKTLWEKEKLLVMSNFSFSHSVFYLFEELSAIFMKFENVVCKLFEFGRV